MIHDSEKFTKQTNNDIELYNWKPWKLKAQLKIENTTNGIIVNKTIIKQLIDNHSFADEKKNFQARETRSNRLESSGLNKLLTMRKSATIVNNVMQSNRRERMKDEIYKQSYYTTITQSSKTVVSLLCP